MSLGADHLRRAGHLRDAHGRDAGIDGTPREGELVPAEGACADPEPAARGERRARERGARPGCDDLS